MCHSVPGSWWCDLDIAIPLQLALLQSQILLALILPLQLALVCYLSYSARSDRLLERFTGQYFRPSGYTLLVAYTRNRRLVRAHVSGGVDASLSTKSSSIKSGR